MASPGSRRLRGRDSLKDHHVAAPRQQGSQLPGQRVPGTSVSHETGGCWGRGRDGGGGRPSCGTGLPWNLLHVDSGQVRGRRRSPSGRSSGAETLPARSAPHGPRTGTVQPRGAHGRAMAPVSALASLRGALPFGLQNPLTRNPSLPGESEVRETLGGPPPRCCHPAAGLPPWYWHSGARPRLQSPLVANVLSSRGTGGEASLRGLGRALPSSARPRMLTCGTRKVAARSSWCISDQPFVPRRVSVENTQTRGRVGSSSFVLPSDFS